jgi:FkbM family methyltransferase
MITLKEKLNKLFEQKFFPPNPLNNVHTLFSNKKLILYGAGSGFITFSVHVLKKYGFKIHAILDRRFNNGDSFFGSPAFSPDNYITTQEEKEKSLVVITVGKEQYYQEILSSLHSLGFKNIINANDVYEYHIPLMPVGLEQKGFSYYLENKKQIFKSFDLLSDDLSREIYASIIQIHLQRIPARIKSNPLMEQYFPKDIKLSKGYSRIINCGSYNGDTIRQLNVLYGKVDTVACFEPDQNSFQALSQFLCLNHNQIANNVFAYPCGVYENEVQLSFSTGDQINSRISDEGDTVVQCVALDHVLPGFKPTYINMDIEGAELQALKGAEKLIIENKPDLAICLYHSPNHLWEIPLFLDNLNLGYKFFIRNYTSFVAETLLYATAI